MLVTRNQRITDLTLSLGLLPPGVRRRPVQADHLFCTTPAFD